MRNLGRHFLCLICARARVQPARLECKPRPRCAVEELDAFPHNSGNSPTIFRSEKHARLVLLTKLLAKGLRLKVDVGDLQPRDSYTTFANFEIIHRPVDSPDSRSCFLLHDKCLRPIIYCSRPSLKHSIASRAAREERPGQESLHN